MFASRKIMIMKRLAAVLVVALMSCSVIAQTPGVTLNSLPAAPPLVGSEAIPESTAGCNGPGCTYRTSPAAIATYVRGGLGTLTNTTIDSTSNSLIGVYAAASILRARDYGILPTNADTVNDTGFALLKTKMQSSATTVWHVIFEPGAYTYTNNRWLYGVNQVIIDAYGTTFQNTNNDGGFVDEQPLNIYNFFSTGGDVSIFSQTHANGFQINTAAAGDVFVATSSAADAAQFSAGMPAIIYGYDQQGDTQPPDMRYFEYVTVSAASTTAIATLGSITGGNYTANGGAHTYGTAASPIALTTSGSGTGATAIITVAGNTVIAVKIVAPGTGYAVNDTISATTANLGAAGTAGLIVPVTALGAVTFADPLKNLYDSRWQDTQMTSFGNLYFGAPRIYPLANTAYTNYNFPQLIWVKGATFIPNPNAPTNKSLQLAANLLIYEDVTSQAANFVMGNKAIVKRSTFVGGANACDKLQDSVTIEDSTLNALTVQPYSITDCVGTNSVTLTRNKLYGDVNISPRSLSMSGNDIIPKASGNFAGIVTLDSWPIRSVELDNNRVFNTGGISFGFSNTASPGFALTAGTGSTANTIELTYNQTVADRVDYGMLFTDATTGCVSTAATAIYVSGGSLVITAPGCTYTSGDTINIYDVMAKYDGGGNTIVGAQVPFWRNAATPVDGIKYPAGSVFPDISIGGTGLGKFNLWGTGNFFQSNGALPGTVRMYANNTQIWNVSSGVFSLAAPTNINASNNAATNIGTGTTSSLVTVGGGSDGVIINSGLGTGYIKDTALISTGTKFTAVGTGCTVGATTGGASAGTFALAAGPCTSVAITINGATGLTAPTGWACRANDRTAPTVLIGGESSSTATTATLTIPAGAGATDVISFGCTGF